MLREDNLYLGHLHTSRKNGYGEEDRGTFAVINQLTLLNMPPQVEQK